MPMMKIVAMLAGGIAIASPGLAHPHGPAANQPADAEVTRRGTDTDRALLTALEARRAQLGQRSARNRDAHDFLDNQIALLRGALDRFEAPAGTQDAPWAPLADSPEEARMKQKFLENLLDRRALMISAPATDYPSEANRAEAIAMVDYMILGVLTGTPEPRIGRRLPSE
jgi:hypothetical protein